MGLYWAHGEGGGGISLGPGTPITYLYLDIYMHMYYTYSPKYMLGPKIELSPGPNNSLSSPGCEYPCKLIAVTIELGLIYILCA